MEREKCPSLLTILLDRIGAMQGYDVTKQPIGNNII
jgi:hypothetical protein